jgi:predicted ArsR family transcriptional regulator
MRPLDAIGEPGARDALDAVRGSAAPLTADEVAIELGVHRNVARARLERLAAAGLLLPAYERRTERSGPGAGRPAKTYAAAVETEALEYPARRYERLLDLVLQQLPVRGRSKRIGEAGVAFGRELAAVARLRAVRRPAAALESVAQALRSLGYQAAVESAGPSGGVIASPTCPLRPLVASASGARELDRGMWRGLVASALAGVDADEVSCEASGCSDDHASCRIRITLRDR